LASEYIERSTITKVAEDIEKRKGHYSKIVRRIIRELKLTYEESLTLSLLSLARRPVPFKVVTEVVEFDAVKVLRDLYRLSLVERQENDHISIVELLKNFVDLQPLKPEEVSRFHEEAAKSFAVLARSADEEQELEWSIEAKYHAIACDKIELAPDIGDLADGAIGACREFIKAREYDKAKLIVEQLLKTRRTDEISEMAARIYANIGDCDEALSLAKEACSKPGKNTWILTEVGRCSLIFNRTDVAESAVALAKATGDINSYIHILEGRIFLKKGRKDLAIEAFKKAVEISQHDGLPHFYLGRELIKNGDIGTAINVLEEGEEVECSRWHQRRWLIVAIRTNLGIANLLDGDLDNAETWLKLVVEEGSPEVARAFAYIKIRANMGVVTEKALTDLDPKKARNRFERCQIRLFRGLFYLSAGIPDNASHEFKLASEADPRNLFVLLRWVDSLIEISKDLKAEGELEAAYKCAEQAKTIAEKVLEYDKRNKQAIEILETICDKFNVFSVEKGG